MKKITLVTFLIVNSIYTFSQTNISDSAMAVSIFSKALTDDWAIQNLEKLVTKYPYRLCGTKAVSDAVDWSEKTLKELGADTVFRQNLKVLHWERGEKETGIINSKTFGKEKVNVCAIGVSIGTEVKGVNAQVVEVQDFDELNKIGKENIKGKIVFFNRAMDSKFYNTFPAYGGAVNQRSRGASEAAKYGAIAVIVRSLTLSTDTFPHTGIMRYDTNYIKIPAFCISTFHANQLSKQLTQDNNLTLFLKSNCKMLSEENSYNVVAEIKGTDYPNEYITMGGHIDSWDITSGAHDDGSGIIHSMEVLKLFKDLGIKPKHTIRIVMFMDEEMDQRGAKKYLEIAIKNNEKHIAALESDAGGATPMGISINASDTVYNKLLEWSYLFEIYGITQIIKGYSGVDISPLKSRGVPLFDIIPDSQRYFDYHHSANDTFDKVNNRELQLGSASYALLIYLIDKYGL